MARVAVHTFLAACVAWLSGCGTVKNLQGDGTPYGGVGTDARAAAVAWQDWSQPSGACIPPAFDLMRAGYLTAVDLPLSAVGDTLTLPFTIIAALQNPPTAGTPTPQPRALPSVGQSPRP